MCGAALLGCIWKLRNDMCLQGKKWRDQKVLLNKLAGTLKFWLPLCREKSVEKLKWVTGDQRNDIYIFKQNLFLNLVWTSGWLFGPCFNICATVCVALPTTRTCGARQAAAWFLSSHRCGWGHLKQIQLALSCAESKYSWRCHAHPATTEIRIRVASIIRYSTQ